MRRCYRLLAAVSCGGMTFGWLQALDMVSFSDIWTNFISLLLQILVTVLFGGDPSAYLGTGGAPFFV